VHGGKKNPPPFDRFALRPRRSARGINREPFKIDSKRIDAAGNDGSKTLDHRGINNAALSPPTVSTL
jgi:hypothetical protein